MQGKELNKRFSTEVQWLGLSTVIKTVNFQCNDQRHVEYVKINRYRQLALDGVVDTHMDFTSSDAGSSPTYGGPQLSRQNQKPLGKTKKPHGKTKNLTAKPKTSRQKQITSRQNQSYFAVKYLVLPWGILFLPWGFWFCREVFCFCREVFGFAIMFLFLPWGFWFCRDVFGFAVTVVGHHTLHTTYCFLSSLIYYFKL